MTEARTEVLQAGATLLAAHSDGEPEREAEQLGGMDEARTMDATHDGTSR